MTPLQKSILSAVKRRPMTLRELQNNLQVDNSRLRTTVSAMVATGHLSVRNGTYVPGFATYQNEANPNTIPCTLVKLAARADPAPAFPLLPRRQKRLCSLGGQIAVKKNDGVLVKRHRLSKGFYVL